MDLATLYSDLRYDSALDATVLFVEHTETEALLAITLPDDLNKRLLHFAATGQDLDAPSLKEPSHDRPSPFDLDSPPPPRP